MCADGHVRPGTGKTVTMVEAMLQLLLNKPTTRILACAPSNSAADIIAERLAAVLNTDQLFRFYAASRFKNQAPDRLLDYAHFLPGTETFSVPPMARLRRFRVIVATCVSASVPYGIGMPRGHFSHIFVDEAGQATEPEVMIAVKTMCDRATNVVLSGDPRQLGPIIRSNIAQKLGLETSLLERLMRLPIYAETIGYGVTFVNFLELMSIMLTFVLDWSSSLRTSGPITPSFTSRMSGFTTVTSRSAVIIRRYMPMLGGRSSLTRTSASPLSSTRYTARMTASPLRHLSSTSTRSNRSANTSETYVMTERSVSVRRLCGVCADPISSLPQPTTTSV
jgi:hypothetical protein